MRLNQAEIAELVTWFVTRFGAGPPCVVPGRPSSLCGPYESGCQPGRRLDPASPGVGNPREYRPRRIGALAGVFGYFQGVGELLGVQPAADPMHRIGPTRSRVPMFSTSGRPSSSGCSGPIEGALGSERSGPRRGRPADLADHVADSKRRRRTQHQRTHRVPVRPARPRAVRVRAEFSPFVAVRLTNV